MRWGSQHVWSSPSITQASSSLFLAPIMPALLFHGFYLLDTCGASHLGRSPCLTFPPSSEIKGICFVSLRVLAWVGFLPVPCGKQEAKLTLYFSTIKWLQGTELHPNFRVPVLYSFNSRVVLCICSRVAVDYLTSSLLTALEDAAICLRQPLSEASEGR